MDPDFNIDFHLAHELKSKMAEVQELSQQLYGQLALLPLKDAAMYQLPLPDKEDEKAHPDFIQVIDKFSGNHSLDTIKTMALSALTSFYAPHGQEHSTRLVQRWPGFIQFSCPKPEAIDLLISNLNELCLAIILLTREHFSGHQARWEVLHHLFPRLMSHQLRRTIIMPEPAPDRLRFYWAHKNNAPKVTKKIIIDQLQKSKSRLPVGHTEQSWCQLIDSEIRQVEDCPYKLVIRRPIRVKPMVSLSYKSRYGSGQSIRSLERTATTPIVIFGEKPLKITPLGHYEKNTTKKGPTAQLGTDLLIPRLHLYYCHNVSV